LRIGYLLWAVFVHEGYASALVEEVEFREAPFLALILRRWRGLRHGVANGDRRAVAGDGGEAAAVRVQVGPAASTTRRRNSKCFKLKALRTAAASQIANTQLRAVELERRIREQNDLEARLDDLEGLLEETERRTYAGR
jgi:hypothetical protein